MAIAPHRWRSLGATLALAMVISGCAQYSVTQIMPFQPTHPEGDQSVFASRVATFGNFVLTGLVAPAHERSETDPGTAETVIRLGQRQSSGDWQWVEQVIDSRTVVDPWHTQPSVAFDRDGYIHVAYGMHNDAWRYVRSARPLDISDMRSPRSSTPGSEIRGAIPPGEQVTYPMFFKSPTGQLLLTYRFAAHPTKKWPERTFSGGLASYEEATGVWTAIGGTVGQSTALISEPGYWVYLPIIGFQEDGSMYLAWSWRTGNAGRYTGAISFAESCGWIADGDCSRSGAELPLSRAARHLVPPLDPEAEFNAKMDLAVAANGDALLVVHPRDRSRTLLRYSAAMREWTIEGPTPMGGPIIRIDAEGREWVFATGIRSFYRVPNGPWIEGPRIGEGLCDPWVVAEEAGRGFLVWARGCEDRKAGIWRLHTSPAMVTR